MKKTQWETVPYIKANGEKPVSIFLDSLYPKEKAKVLRSIQLLEEFGMNLKGPHKDYLDDGIHELRTKLASNIFRVTLFHVEGNKIVLLHGFQKKTQKTPPREIARAKQYRDDYLKQQRGDE